MNSRTHKRNHLTFAPDKLEDRVLFSASTIASVLPPTLAPVPDTAQPLRSTNPTAPTVVRSLQSSNPLEIQTRSTTLRVQATDDQGESNLTYSWSVESAPEGANVTFHTNRSNQAKNVVARFDRAGTYTFLVDITDRQGQTVSDRLQVNVRPVMTGITIVQPDVAMVPGRAVGTVSVASPKFTVLVRDQFGNSMAPPQGLTWKVDAAPAEAKPQLSTSGTEAILRLDRQGSYRVSANLGRFSVTSRFDAVPQLSRVDILHVGKRIEPGSTLATTTLNHRFTIQGFDQFGQRWTQPTQWTWSATSPTAETTANISSTSGKANVAFNQTGTYALVVANGRASNSFNVQVAAKNHSANTNTNTSTNTATNNGATIGRSIRVANQAELKLAMSQAIAGDTILLQGGVNFGDLKIYKPAKPYTGMVTIRSSDPNERAIFNSLTFEAARNITLDGIRVVNLSRYSSVIIGNSSDIVLKNSEVTANLIPGQLGQSFRSGIGIGGSTRITISGNRISGVSTALGAGGSSNILIEDNVFRDNLLDNANFGSNISDLMYRRNTLYSQAGDVKPGHHYDNIQFWVQTDATQNSRNITVTQNTIYDLSGAVNAQAIFGRGDYSDANGIENPYGFENVEISYNVIVTQHANAISFTDAKGIRVVHNTLVYAGDHRSDIRSVKIPGIGVTKSSDVLITNNILPRKGNPSPDTATRYNNTVYDIASGELAELLVNPYAPQPTRGDFATLAVTSLRNTDGSYRGSLTVTAQSQRPTALFTYSRQVQNGQFVYSFDASTSLAASDLDLQNARFQWQFADGTTAEGSRIEKAFARAGSQDVTLTITDRLDRQHTFKKEDIIIRDTAAISVQFDDSLADSTSTKSNLQAMGQTQFSPRAGGGSAVVLGGEQGHLYIAPSDPDLSEMTSTRQITIAASIQANANENAIALPLFNRHGMWGLSLQPNGSLRFSVAGTTHTVSPPTQLFSGNWNEIALTVTANSFSLYVNGTNVYSSSLAQNQPDVFFQAGGYGIGIGGSGPWASNRAGTKFQLDNLFIGTAALTDQQIAAMALRNSL